MSSTILKDKRIILGVTGSIAAVETIKLARELIRHGAEVYPVMTHASTKIIHPDSLWFATGNKPITELTGATEHVSFCGKTKKQADLLLICPSTANTISKISHGIDDTAVTTFATTALGSKIPVIIVPAMHGSMYDHKILQENIKKCKKNNILFVEPEIQGNKAKIPSNEKILAKVFCEFSNKKLKGKKILIIGGSTVEEIDDVRVLTNLSSGKTAISLCKNAFYHGAKVELWYGQSFEKIPDFVPNKRFKSLNSLFNLLEQNPVDSFDYIILCAALSDFIPEKKKGKISSKKYLKINFITASKFIKKLRENTKDSIVVAFKLEENSKNLEKNSKDFLKSNNVDYVVANTLKGLENDDNEIWIYDKKGKFVHKKGTKDVLSNIILKSIVGKN